MSNANDGIEELEVTNCDLQSCGQNGSPAFTEQGVAMISNVLHSAFAIQVNIEITRVFVQLREIIYTHKELAQKLEDLEQKYDAQFRVVFDGAPSDPRPTKKASLRFSSQQGFISAP